MYYLTAKNGNFKGTAWPLSEEPLFVGRDIGCHVVLKDPLVSRRHFEVRMVEGRARLHDLGSSNATFVNGLAVKEAHLKAGDEIAIGGAIFLVAEADAETRPPDTYSGAELPTRALNIGEPLYLNKDCDSLFTHGKPRSAGDLVALFHLGRELSQARSRDTLIHNLLDRIEAHFEPAWAAVVLCDEGTRRFQVWPKAASGRVAEGAPLLPHVRNAIHGAQGILLPERGGDGHATEIRTTIIAPIVFGEERLGALVLQAETPRRMYDETDLEFLIAVSHSAAPNLKAVEKMEALERENRRLVAGTPGPGAIVGDSRAIAEVRDLARTCARTELSVLILGETGTGKELVARLVHALSDRVEKPLTVVNCAAIPDELFESEVFGYEKGAFTGAEGRKTGLFEESDGGTLFLDEVGDLSLHNQARLLRAIETGTFRRLGGTTDVRANVRIIAATNKDLAAAAEAGRFRRDLYHRLNQFEIHVPPLRERRSDIPAIARHLLDVARRRTPTPATDFAPETLKALQDRRWEGNVRELRNVIERAALVARGPLIEPGDLVPDAYARLRQDEPFLTLEELEKRHIMLAVSRCKGNIKVAAEMLGIGRSTLYRKLAEYGIPT